MGEAHCVLVLTGAGISTDSGIPDFRGPEGLWTRNPEAERLSTLDAYLGDEAVRRRAWQGRLFSPTWSANPNAGHRAIVALEHQGKLDTLVTQNIDGLHQLAGNDPTKVIEIHGTIREIVCMSCARPRTGRNHPRSCTCRRRGPRLQVVWGNSQVGHDQLRAVIGGRRSGAGRARRLPLRPTARGREQFDGVPGSRSRTGGGRQRSPDRDRQRGADSLRSSGGGGRTRTDQRLTAVHHRRWLTRESELRSQAGSAMCRV